MFFGGRTALTDHYDLIVLGNKTAAVLTAVRAAKQGLCVALACIEELLCSEFSESLICTGTLAEDGGALLKELEVKAIPTANGGLHMPQGLAAKAGLQLFQKYGVHFYPLTAPVAIAKNKEQVGGVVMASKFGAFLMKGRVVLDSTGFFNTHQSEELRSFTYCVQLGKVLLNKIQLPLKLSMPAIPDIYNIQIFSDSRSADTCVLHFDFQGRRGTKLSAEALSKTAQLLGALRKENEIFEDATLQKVSLKPLEQTVAAVSDNHGLLCADLSFAVPDFLTKPLFKALTAYSYLPPNEVVFNGEVLPLSALLQTQQLDPYLGVDLPLLHLPTAALKSVQCDLFIAGMGTGGFAALQGAKKQNCSLFFAESKPMPGGTRTLGQVSALWHGYPSPFVSGHIEAVKNFMQQKFGGMDYNAYTGEMLYELFEINESKAGAAFSSIVFGTEIFHNRITAVLLATPHGVMKIAAKQFIDATGDADLASLSGCALQKAGDPVDGVFQGCSTWGESPAGTAWNDSPYKGDADCISTAWYSEFLRATYVNQLHNSDLGFSPLLTVRESRRLKGRYTLNMADILTEQTFEDTVAVGSCLYDCHGFGSSPAYFTSLFDPLLPLKENEDLKIRIPLRALQPQKRNGLLVIAKAISATRDAACLIRMNADIMNVGFSAGLLAATAAVLGCDPEQKPLKLVQKQLQEEKVLPNWAMTVSPKTTAQRLEALQKGDLKTALPLSLEHSAQKPLRELFQQQEKPAAYPAALLLAAMDDITVFEPLNCSFKKLTDNASAVSKNRRQLMTLCTLLARLAGQNTACRAAFLASLSLLLTNLKAGGDRIDPKQDIYYNSKVANRTVPNFKLLLTAARAAAMVADPLLIVPLEQLMQQPGIALTNGAEIHTVQLYLQLLSAASRCGHQPAAKALCAFLEDPHVFFRDTAQQTLTDLYPEVSAKTAAAWRHITENTPPVIAPLQTNQPFWD